MSKYLRNRTVKLKYHTVNNESICMYKQIKSNLLSKIKKHFINGYLIPNLCLSNNTFAFPKIILLLLLIL